MENQQQKDENMHISRVNQRKTQGFTIIELVIVIAILGILSAVAIPKLFNITGDAQSAATSGVAGA